MLFLLLCFMFLPYVFGGSQCPPREKIYPCICIDRSIGKSKFDTTVICHGLANGESLLAIETNLAEIEINKFLLYDSYWLTDSAKLLSEARIPVNHLSGFRMEEIEVVDTAMSNFGCPKEDNCRTYYLKRFTAINSSISDRSSCNNNGMTVNSWISCPSNVEHLTINSGFPSDSALKPEFFPEPMSKLKALHLPNNKISRIDKRTFTHSKFPVLHTLDLSYNTMRDIRHLFSSILKVKILDLSNNYVRNMLDIQYLPNLQTLKLNHNHIITLLESDWHQMPSGLRHIDLSHNNIQCGCDFKWINSTFHINTVLLGSCASPSQVVTKKLRKASRFVTERCDKDGNIGPKIKRS